MIEETPLGAIKWLTLRAKRIKIGDNPYLEVAGVIRALIRDRKQLREALAFRDKQEQKKVADKEAKKIPFGVQANDSWDVK